MSDERIEIRGTLRCEGPEWIASIIVEETHTVVRLDELLALLVWERREKLADGALVRLVIEPIKIHSRGLPGLGPATLCGVAGPVPEPCGWITCEECNAILSESGRLHARALVVEHEAHVDRLAKELESAVLGVARTLNEEADEVTLGREIACLPIEAWRAIADGLKEWRQASAAFAAAVSGGRS